MTDVAIKELKDKKEVDAKSGYYIYTIDDLYEIIRVNTKWREALRRELLSPALLNLPEEFSRFRNDEFKPLVKKVDKIETDVAVLKQDVTVLKQDVAVLKQDVAILKEKVKKLIIDVAELQGSDLERRVREKAAAYLGKVIRRCRTLSHDQLANSLDDALDAGNISEDMRSDAILIDVVVIGRLFTDPQKEAVLAVEVSRVVDVEDVRRANRRASVIGQAMGLAGIGIAFGKSCTKGATIASEELDVVLICQTNTTEQNQQGKSFNE